MNSTEQFNLLWLMRAMTVPVNYDDERYYYDGQLKELFSITKSKTNPFEKVVLNTRELRYSTEIESDLFVRLELIDDESSEIIEIPRINVAEKIGIQLEFLSKMPGTFWHNELIAAVEQQKDDFKFVLDSVLIENDNSASMVTYWDDYKLKIVFGYLSKFIKSTDLDWKLLN